MLGLLAVLTAPLPQKRNVARAAERRADAWRRSAITCLLLAPYSLWVDATAAQERFELPEIVVSASRQAEPLARIPKNVAVITAEDLERSTSTDVADLISREAGVNLRSFFGQEKNAVIDIRGYGQSAGSNVLILVDGVPLNAPDLSAPDLSSVALEAIERIEIIRGPGAVEYGDKAVGGVINILTRAPRAQRQLKASVSLGSGGSRRAHVRAGGGNRAAAISINASWQDAPGYRDNGDLRKTDFGTRLELTPREGLRLHGQVTVHEDRYGLPGALPANVQRDSQARRRTVAPRDYGETLDKRASAGFTAAAPALGSITGRLALRERDNDFIIGFTPTLSEEDQKGHIDERSTRWTLDYANQIQAYERKHQLRAGWSYFTTDFSREVITQRSRQHADLSTHAWYLGADLAVLPAITVRTGYRHERTWLTRRVDVLTDFFGPPPLFPLVARRYVNGVPRQTTWESDAAALGATFTVGPDTTLFANYEKTFRTPNVDELALAAAGLRPQHGEHTDFGFRTVLGDLAELSATAFRTAMRNEIFFGFDPAQGQSVNRNFEGGTRRHGIELDLRLYPHEHLYLWLNFTAMHARFEGRGTRVPLVPERTLNFGFEVDLSERWLATFAGRWVSSRIDGNDEDNRSFAELPSYKVFDTKVRYRHRDFEIQAGVNNLLNELYSTLAFSQTIFPMPERTAYVSASATF